MVLKYILGAKFKSLGLLLIKLRGNNHNRGYKINEKKFEIFLLRYNVLQEK